MTWWMILLIILAAIWLLLQIRLGGNVRYGADGIFVDLLLGPFRYRVMPARKEKEPKPKREKKSKQEKAAGKPEGAPEEKPGTLSRLMKLLPVVTEFLGALKRRIRIDELFLSVVWGGCEDAAAAAIGYGRANAAIGMIWPVLDHNFKVKRSSFHIDVDYSAAEPAVKAEAAVTLTVWQLLYLAVRYGLKALLNWTRSGKPAKQ